VSPLSSTPAAAQVPAQTRPEIVVLCGSTRFRDRFDLANFDLTMDGAIVLAPGVWVRSSPPFSDLPDDLQVSGKAAIDELHKRKIDLADRVYVINVGGYIGDSTRSEIEYAEKLGKPIDYLEPVQ